MVPIVGGEAGERGESGLVGLDAVTRDKVAKGGEDGFTSGGLEEAERPQEVLVAGADADHVPEHVFRRHPPSCWPACWS